MNKSNKNNLPNGSDESTDKNQQQAADQTVSAIESAIESTIELSSTDRVGSSEFQTGDQLLGEAIRSSANLDLPTANRDLRELLTAEIENADVVAQVPTAKNELPTPEVSAVTTGPRWKTIAAIAATTLVMCGLGYWIWAGGQNSETGFSFFTPSEQADSELNKGVNLTAGSDIIGELDLEKIDRSQNFDLMLPSIGQAQDGQVQQEPEVILSSTKKAKLGSVVTTEKKRPVINGVDSDHDRVTNGPYSASGRYEGQYPENENLDFRFYQGLARRSETKNYNEELGAVSGTYYSTDIVPNGEGFGGGGFGSRGSGTSTERSLYSEEYAKINDNPFRETKGHSRVSTFSIDVDTASYANIRRFINNGQRVPPNAVRIEEMVNYFDYQYEQPDDEKPFSVNMELATCPWNQQHKLLRVGLKGKEVHQEERPASNIVFLLDVSESMKSADKLPLLKNGVEMMVNQLTANDRVTIVTYAGNAGIVLEPTPGNQKRKIVNAIRNLNAGGSTNGSAGIQLAYQLAQNNFVEDGTNKVILATDGDLNVGVTSDEALVELITEKAKEGVFLTVLGFGTGNLKDSKLEQLADNGNGMYAYIDGVREAHKVLVEGISGSLVTIAKDVKLQIEFNPAEVKSYRLIGYENRILAREDFDNDAKDAGEIGAGHTVTAIYELATTDSPAAVEPTIPGGFKYQQPEQQPEPADDPNSDAGNGELLTLALRFKKPDSDVSKRIEFTLQNENNTFSGASSDFRFASSVAAFGMILRQSQHRGSATTDWVAETATGALGADLSGYRKEFIDLVRRSNSAH